MDGKFTARYVLHTLRKKTSVVIISYPKLHITKKSIWRHLHTARHKQALHVQNIELELKARRTRVGLSVGRAALQTIREGCSYLQFEEKLPNLHLSGLEIGSMNHSVRFIKGFVDNMAAVMDRRIRDHMHVVDVVTCRKRLFAFVADKVTELHRTGDDVDMVIMTEEGELKPIFLEYLLVTKHTRHGLMSEIYEKTFVKKLGLTPEDIRNQCTGAAFDG